MFAVRKAQNGCCPYDRHTAYLIAEKQESATAP